MIKNANLNYYIFDLNTNMLQYFA